MGLCIIEKPYSLWSNLSFIHSFIHSLTHSPSASPSHVHFVSLLFFLLSPCVSLSVSFIFHFPCLLFLFSFILSLLLSFPCYALFMLVKLSIFISIYLSVCLFIQQSIFSFSISFVCTYLSPSSPWNYDMKKWIVVCMHLYYTHQPNLVFLSHNDFSGLLPV